MPDLHLETLLHGGDYNPEQWPREIWDEDMVLMKKASVNIATLPVFGWGNIQKDEDTWDFEWVDAIVEKLHVNGVRICLCTATAATPPWVDAKYPDILRTDETGRKRRHGGRHTFCPHSQNFRRLSTGLARKMAERFGHHPAVLLWHVSNEYCYSCYCDACSAAFRVWLQSRYGTLDELNHRYNTAFWGQTFTDWDQIEAPVHDAQRNFQALLIDYDRFQTEAVLSACEAEIAVIREVTPNLPITTNMMGTYKPLDYHRFAKPLDIVSWDSYPRRNATFGSVGLRHSLMRGLKEGKPWLLMENTPSQQNWAPYNSLKRPGILRLWAWQAIAHGSEACMYFQWRKSPGAQEMFHGAVVEHSGREDARVFQEVVTLGDELARLGPQIVGSRVVNEVAIVFDWDNWWAVEYSSGPSVDLKYLTVVETYYDSFTRLGLSPDVVGVDADLSKYKLVVAPLLKMVKPGFAEKIKAHVDRGATFLTTFFSGIVDQNDRAFPNGYPGPFADLLGIWVEEFDALPPDESNQIRLADGTELPCGLLCDRIRLEGAAPLAEYQSDFYAHEPAATTHYYGAGKAVYIGTHLAPKDLAQLLDPILNELNLTPPITTPHPDIEATIRQHPDGTKLHFLLNHGKQTLELPLTRPALDLITNQTHQTTLSLAPNTVAILT